MSAFVEDACSRCLNTPCTCPREFENFILGAGWNRERLYGECCMHVDDDGSFDCDRALEFFRGSDDGACEEHAEAMGAIVRKAAVPTTPVPEARLAAAYDAYTNPKETKPMAKTIWKFPAPINDTLTIPMPLGASVLSVQVQHGEPCLWARVDPTMPVEPRHFHWRGTGHPADVLGPFVGTIQLANGGLVFHLFEGPKPA